ncbi:MAG: DUF6754 domain-containing protein [Bacillota bacterium]
MFGIWKEGYFTSCIFIFAFIAIVYYYLRRARAGLPIPEIRKIPGLEAVDEAIGRATEMGRPVHFTPGSVGFDSAGFASFAVLGHVAKICARYDTRIVVTTRSYIIQAVLDEIVRSSFLEAGRPDSYNPDDIRYLSGYQFAAAAMTLGIFVREAVAANIMIGYFYAESLLYAEAGSQIGAIQIAGTTNNTQIAFFIAACDYTLIGEEMFAAGAYLSKDPILNGTVVAQDIMKQALLAVIIIGTVMASTGSAELLKGWLAK